MLTTARPRVAGPAAYSGSATHDLESLVAQATSRGTPVPGAVDTLHLVSGLPTSAVTMERLCGDALGSGAGPLSRW